MTFPLFLARRLTFSSEGNRKAPAIRVAIIAVALSVAVMLGAIAIVLGFQREIRDRIIGFNSHITLYAIPQEETGESNLVSLSPTLKTILGEMPFVTDVSLEAAIPAIMKTNDSFKGVYLKSCNDSRMTDFLRSNLEEGKVPDFMNSAASSATAEAETPLESDTASFQVLISRKAADELRLKAGDKINTYFINDRVKVRPLRVSGIYNSHFDAYDNAYIYGDLKLIQQLGDLLPSEGTAIKISTDNFEEVETYTGILRQKLTEALAEGMLYKYYQVDNARRQGAGYFRWLAMLDTNVVVIIVLMTFVACITLISAMLIIILDKKRFIGLLRSMGARKRTVRSVFVYMALRIGLGGMIIGNVLMLGLLYVQDRWHLLPLDPDAYYIDFVPVHFSWLGFGLLNLGVVIVLWFTLILPSVFASRISPAVTMRYE